MKKEAFDRRAIAAILCIGVLFGVIYASAVIVNGASADGSTMFINDEPWYNEELYGWGMNNTVVYVPVTVFAKLGNVEIKENKYLQNVMITKGSKYITIDTSGNREFAYTEERGEFYMKTYMMRSNTLWVPAVVICDYFGFGFEINKTKTAIRISDSEGTKTLNELLITYNPQYAETTTTSGKTEPAVTTNPPVTVPQTPEIEVMPDKLIYLTFEDAPNEYTAEILDLLAKYNYKATFFLNGSELADNADIVRRIVTEGHSIGLHTMTGNETAFASDFDSFIAELEQENELLYKLIKQKSRFVRAPEGSSSENFFITTQNGTRLNDSGYIVWDWNVYVADDDESVSEYKAISGAVAGIKKYSVPTLRFHSNSVTPDILNGVLVYMAQYSQFSVRAITPSSYEVNFIGLFQ